MIIGKSSIIMKKKKVVGPLSEYLDKTYIFHENKKETKNLEWLHNGHAYNRSLLTWQIFFLKLPQNFLSFITHQSEENSPRKQTHIRGPQCFLDHSLKIILVKLLSAVLCQRTRHQRPARPLAPVSYLAADNWNECTSPSNVNVTPQQTVCICLVSWDLSDCEKSKTERVPERSCRIDKQGS